MVQIPGKVTGIGDGLQGRTGGWVLSFHCSRDMVRPQWELCPSSEPPAELSCGMRSNQVIPGGVGSCGMSCSKPRSPNNPIKVLQYLTFHSPFGLVILGSLWRWVLHGKLSKGSEEG